MPIKVDASLAKGLRSSILKRITDAKQSTNRAALKVFDKKQTMPTTKKGAKKLYKELAKYMDKFALASNNVQYLTRYAHWHRWQLREDVPVDNWEEDQLSVNAISFDLLHPSARYFATKYPIGLSMHLLERCFMRLNTTDNEVVLKELLDVSLYACTLSYFLLLEMDARGIKEIPIMFVTRHGVIVGDAVLGGELASGMLQFRTYLSLNSELSTAKKRLIMEMDQWQKEFDKQMDDVVAVSVNGNDIFDNREDHSVLESIKHAQSYLDILIKNHHALEDKAGRMQRQSDNDLKWNRNGI